MADIELISGKPTLEQAIKSTQNPSFPLITLKLKKKSGIKNTTYDIEVTPTFYQWVKEFLGGDEIHLFFVPGGDPIRSWTPDMGIAFEVMAELKIMNPINIWERIARETIDDFLKDKSNAKLKRNDSVIPICEEILDAYGLLEPKSKFDSLKAIAKDAILNKNRDNDTVIYKMAMVVYHYSFNSNTIEGLEDWEKSYLAFRQNESIHKKFPSIKQKINSVRTENLQKTFKTFLAFLIGAYVYYMGVKEIVKK